MRGAAEPCFKEHIFREGRTNVASSINLNEPCHVLVEGNYTPQECGLDQICSGKIEIFIPKPSGLKQTETFYIPS